MMMILIISIVSVLTINYRAVAAAPVVCSQQYQCSGVTNDYNFVACDNGFCRCRSELGFVGAATNVSKCGCLPPYQIYWQKYPYCIKLTDAVAYHAENSRNNILLQKVSMIYQSQIWPTPQYIMGQLIAGQADTGILSTIFAPSAHGRVDPIGEFKDYDGVLEYFYGSIFTPYTNIRNVWIQKIHVQDNVVSSRIVFKLNYYNFPNADQILYSVNITQTAIFTFDNNNLVSSVEAINHNLGWAFENFQFFTNPAALFGVTCNNILNIAKCDATNDPLGYYTDMTDCINFMASIKLGTLDKVRENSVVCREYHSTLAMARPSVHCPHTGKTGGAKCVANNYADYYLSNY